MLTSNICRAIRAEQDEFYQVLAANIDGVVANLIRSGLQGTSRLTATQLASIKQRLVRMPGMCEKAAVSLLDSASAPQVGDIIVPLTDMHSIVLPMCHGNSLPNSFVPLPLKYDEKTHSATIAYSYRYTGKPLLLVGDKVYFGGSQEYSLFDDLVNSVTGFLLTAVAGVVGDCGDRLRYLIQSKIVAKFCKLPFLVMQVGDEATGSNLLLGTKADHIPATGRAIDTAWRRATNTKLGDSGVPVGEFVQWFFSSMLETVWSSVHNTGSEEWPLTKIKLGEKVNRLHTVVIDATSFDATVVNTFCHQSNVSLFYGNHYVEPSAPFDMRVSYDLTLGHKLTWGQFGVAKYFASRNGTPLLDEVFKLTDLTHVSIRDTLADKYGHQRLCAETEIVALTDKLPKALAQRYGAVVTEVLDAETGTPQVTVATYDPENRDIVVAVRAHTKIDNVLVLVATRPQIEHAIEIGYVAAA